MKILRIVKTETREETEHIPIYSLGNRKPVSYTQGKSYTITTEFYEAPLDVEDKSDYFIEKSGILYKFPLSYVIYADNTMSIYSELDPL
jgi:hypothetical protein